MKKNVVVRLLTLSMAVACAITNAPIANVRAAEVTEVTAEEVVEAEDATEVEETAEAEDEVVVYNDADQVFAVGTDGVAYADVQYLTNSVYDNLDEQLKAEYTASCDVISDFMTKGYISGAVFAIDEDGTLYTEYNVCSNVFAGSTSSVKAPKITYSDLDVTAVDLSADNMDDIDLSVFTDDYSDEENVYDIDVDAIVNNTTSEADANVFNSKFDDNNGVMTKNFYYNQLENVGERAAFESCLKAAKKANGKFFWNIDKPVIPFAPDGSAKPTDAATIETIFLNGLNGINAAIVTYPECFDWFNRGAGDKISFITKSKVGAFNTKTVGFNIPKSEYWNKSMEKDAKELVKNMVAQAYATCNAKESAVNDLTYEIIANLDNQLCTMAEYDFDALDPGAEDNYIKGNTKGYYLAHCVYGTLLEHKGVCESYALAMSRLLDEAGIQNLYITGEVETKNGGGGHAWNLIRMSDNNWYILDTTNNDAGKESDGSLLLIPSSYMGINYYGYNSQFANFSFKLPATAYEKYSYFDIHTIFVPLKKQVKPHIADAYDNKNAKLTYNSTNPGIFKVNPKTGKIKGLMLGSAKMEIMNQMGNKDEVDVVVYDITNVSIDGGKSKPDVITGTDNVKTYTFDIAQNEGENYVSPATIYIYNNANMSIKSSNEKVAHIEGWEIRGNKVYVDVKPVKKGKAKITFDFGGKKAFVKLSVK